MGPSHKTFNQVKAILGKLDRSIDQLRAQRTGHNEAPAPAPAGLGITAAAPRSLEAPARSLYGRATPLRS